MAAPKFERYGLWLGCTRPYRRFKSHHTEINDIYWAFAAAAGFSDYLARHSNADADPVQLFQAQGPDTRRLPSNIRLWRKNFSEFQNWTRLAALLSAASYLEIYIKSTIELAMRSDPMARLGRPRLFDGVIWLKEGVRDDVGLLVRPCLIGEWPKRLKSYRKLFGFAPPEVINNVGQLEKMRQFRNNVGHQFGRQIKSISNPLQIDGGAPERLSESRFKRWLDIIDQTATSFDKHLGLNHIGEFESIMHFHRWRLLPRAEREPKYSTVGAFARELRRTVGNSPGRAYVADLINFYNKL